MPDMKANTGLSDSVLITGAGGYLGRQVVAALASDRRQSRQIIAADIRLPGQDARLPDVTYLALDVRAPELAHILRRHKVATCIHLAAVVTPDQNSSREQQFSVDVLGTENVLRSCLKAGVGHLIVTSSGAAYGYHPDNPQWLDERAALRGNPEFAYSDHKRRVEEMLARWRAEHPELKQLVFRPGAILGETTNNQITALFERPIILGLRGADIPFVFIWDQDVVGCVVKGVQERKSGIFNLAGDGVVTMRQIAQYLNKRYLALPAWLVASALWLLQRLHLTSYGPEQVKFLRYRPCLSNRRLKQEFGYTPRKDSREVFEYFAAKRKMRK